MEIFIRAYNNFSKFKDFCIRESKNNTFLDVIIIYSKTTVTKLYNERFKILTKIEVIENREIYCSEKIGTYLNKLLERMSECKTCHSVFTKKIMYFALIQKLLKIILWNYPCS